MLSFHIPIKHCRRDKEVVLKSIEQRYREKLGVLIKLLIKHCRRILQNVLERWSWWRGLGDEKVISIGRIDVLALELRLDRNVWVAHIVCMYRIAFSFGPCCVENRTWLGLVPTLIFLVNQIDNISRLLITRTLELSESSTFVVKTWSNCLTFSFPPSSSRRMDLNAVLF